MREKMGTDVFWFWARYGIEREPVKVRHDGTVTLEEMQAIYPALGDPIPPNAVHEMTIMQCCDTDAIATKTYEQIGDGAGGTNWRDVASYHAGRHFDVSTMSAARPDELLQAVTSLSLARRAFAIRGRLIEGRTKNGVQRTFRDRGKGMPFFEDRPLSWMMLDIDRYELDGDLQPHNVRRYVAEMIQAMGDPFSECSCVVQLSASCGLRERNVLKAHAFFVLDYPLTSDQCLRWVQSIGDRIGKTTIYKIGDDVHIDTSVFRPVQPHYTANPILVGTDPFTHRVFMIDGKYQSVHAEKIDLEIKSHSDGGGYAKNFDHTPSWYIFEAALAEIGDGMRGFNEGVLNASRYASALINHAGYEKAKLIEHIADAVNRADPGNRHHSEIVRYASDDFIRDKIDWFQDMSRREVDGKNESGHSHGE